MGYWKKSTKKPSVTWEETVDEALCVGWIDGVRKRINDESYTIRFTPRRDGSVWSPRNLARVKRLLSEGRMQESGMAAWSRRSESATRGYLERQAPKGFDREQEAAFGTAWAFWLEQPAGYRKQWTYWVLSAKQSATRLRRLEAVVAASKKGQRVNPQRPFNFD